MLNFLTDNKIIDIAGLDEKFKSMIGEQQAIRDKLKPIDMRLKTLDEHIKQSDIYLRLKVKKELTDSEKVLFKAASDYFKDVMNGRTVLPIKAWKAEHSKLTTERKTLYLRYVSLKDEVRKAEQIRKRVYSILRQERQLRRINDIEL